MRDGRWGASFAPPLEAAARRRGAETRLLNAPSLLPRLPVHWERSCRASSHRSLTRREPYTEELTIHGWKEERKGVVAVHKKTKAVTLVRKNTRRVFFQRRKMTLFSVGRRIQGRRASTRCLKHTHTHKTHTRKKSRRRRRRSSSARRGTPRAARGPRRCRPPSRPRPRRGRARSAAASRSAAS